MQACCVNKCLSATFFYLVLSSWIMELHVLFFLFVPVLCMAAPKMWSANIAFLGGIITRWLTSRQQMASSWEENGRMDMSTSFSWQLLQKCVHKDSINLHHASITQHLIAEVSTPTHMQHSYILVVINIFFYVADLLNMEKRRVTCNIKDIQLFLATKIIFGGGKQKIFVTRFQGGSVHKSPFSTGRVILQDNPSRDLSLLF